MRAISYEYRTVVGIDRNASTILSQSHKKNYSVKKYTDIKKALNGSKKKKHSYS